MKSPIPLPWIVTVLAIAPLATGAQDDDTVRVTVKGESVAMVIRVPVRISNFHPSWQGTAIAPEDGPAGEIRCTLLDTAGNSIGQSPEFLLPAIPEGGSYARTLEFEASLHRDVGNPSVAGYRCTLRSMIGLLSKPLLCATAAAAEGSTCEVGGSVDSPQQ